MKPQDRSNKERLGPAELSNSLDRFIRAQMVLSGNVSYIKALEIVKRKYPHLIKKVYGRVR
jgi:hypothetical protein